MLSLFDIYTICYRPWISFRRQYFLQLAVPYTKYSLWDKALDNGIIFAYV